MTVAEGRMVAAVGQPAVGQPAVGAAAFDESAFGESARAATDPRHPASSPGRTRIERRAIERVITAVAADALGASAARIRVDTFDDAGRIGVTVVGPARLGAGPEARMTLLERACDARGVIAQRTAELTGLEIGRVNVRLSGIEPTTQGRVQ